MGKNKKFQPYSDLTNDARFQKAVEILLSHEGGYVNDPDDPGGETHFGISKRSYPDLDIGALTKENVIEIYRRDFWDKYGFERIENDTLAFMLFDQAVLMGPVTAIRMIEAVLRKDLGDLDIEVNGLLADKTVDAINVLHPVDLIDRFKIRAERHYRALDMPKFLDGWLKRLNSWKIPLNPPFPKGDLVGGIDK
jgi:lysozyme family protein